MDLFELRERENWVMVWRGRRGVVVDDVVVGFKGPTRVSFRNCGSELIGFMGGYSERDGF